MRLYLQNGYKLNNGNQSSYTILDRIGEGASCIAYRAVMEATGNECIIKEYYPSHIAIERFDNGDLVCASKSFEIFEAGSRRFRQAIENQIQLRLIDDVGNQTFYVIDSFSENNTYYVVVPRFCGSTYNNNSEMSLYDRMRVCRSVADYAKRCHKARYLCLDIKPDNIFVLPETPEFAMFFDFDSISKLSDISFGKSSSYTETWAAPEQILPGAYKSISYCTDIYILGELIFWSVFDRHSYDCEHRKHSRYKFEESKFSDELSEDAEDILTEIFHNTLRSSGKNRFQRMDELIKKIDDLLVEMYHGKESIISIMPSVASFFVGREDVLENVYDKISENHKVILSGVGGIGKSEIAKQYVEKYKNEYRSIIYLTYSVDLLSTIVNAPFLSEYEQKEEETDIHYCKRKLCKLAELYSGNNLIVIDNLNVELEDIEHKEIWGQIYSLPCDLIITTRCNQEAYYRYQMYIDRLEKEQLEELFNNYCQYEEDEKENVSKIISAVHGHTLVVELIAKQSRMSIKTPHEMLQMLEKKGVLGFDSDNIKWNLKKGTVSDHVKGLFSISDMSEEQKQLMYLMSFMPVSGVDEGLFFDFYEINNTSDMRFLIDNGWISELYGTSRMISMHPVIANIIMDELNNNAVDADEIYIKSMTAMSLWNNKDSINQDAYYAICKSIAIQTSVCGSQSEKAADYLVKYSSAFWKYGNIDERRKLLLQAIEIYDALYGIDKYVAVREYAYNSYVTTINDVNHIEEVRALCSNHLKKAKKNKDLFLQGCWYIQMCKASHVRNSTKNRVSVMYAVYSIKLMLLINRLQRMSKKKNPSLISKEYLDSLHYGYLSGLNLSGSLNLNLASVYEQYSENNVFFARDTWFEVYYYKQAISIRNRYKDAKSVNSSGNSISKIIDLANIDILERRYNEALNRLEEIIIYFEEHNIPSNVHIVVVRDMIGTIALTIGDYERAIFEYNLCLEIANELNLKSINGIRIGLGRAYILNGKLKEAGSLNYQLFCDLKEVDSDNRGTYFAEMYYNVALRYLMMEKFEQAEEYFLHSIEQFYNCSIVGNRRDVGIARSKYQIGKMKYDTSPKVSARYIQDAFETFEKCLGEKHSETIECREWLKKCEPYLNLK